MIEMTRRVTFSAAYKAAEAAEAEEASRLGGHAAPAQGDDRAAGAAQYAGHDYVLDVTVGGEIDPRTGIIINIKELDRIIRSELLAPLRGRLLNNAVPGLCGRPPTPENIVRCVADCLRDHLPREVTLTAVRLEATPLESAEWRQGPTMLLTRVYEFAASHRLHSPALSDQENRELFGKCNNAYGHGHNYVLEVTVEGPVDARTGRVLDPAELDRVVHDKVVDRFDHRHFNHDVPELAGLIPSTEAITRVIWDRLCDHIPGPARLSRIVVRETARNIFEYRGEEKAA